jgi:hypothetical protein
VISYYADDILHLLHVSARFLIIHKYTSQRCIVPRFPPNRFLFILTNPSLSLSHQDSLFHLASNTSPTPMEMVYHILQLAESVPPSERNIPAAT